MIHDDSLQASSVDHAWLHSVVSSITTAVMADAARRAGAAPFPARAAGRTDSSGFQWLMQ